MRFEVRMKNEEAILTSSFEPRTSNFSRKEVIRLRRIGFGIAAWVVAVTAAHFALNVNWQVLMNDRLPEAKRKLNVAYIPVT
jgi:hypothetical protein